MSAESEVVELVAIAVVVLAFVGFAAAWGVRPMFTALDPALGRVKWRVAAVVTMVLVSVLPSFHVASVDSARIHNSWPGAPNWRPVDSLDVGDAGVGALFVTFFTVPTTIVLLVFDVLARRRARRAALATAATPTTVAGGGADAPDTRPGAAGSPASLGSSAKWLTRAVRIDAAALALLLVLSAHYFLYSLAVFVGAMGP